MYNRAAVSDYVCMYVGHASVVVWAIIAQGPRGAGAP